MHLHSLTLRGFKSFASATTFEFTPGINAVVGPNGSGKSNIVDALAWVMGEQGAKSLRGGSMQDVIFAGAGAEQGGKSALGRAKVSLRIDNSDGALTIPSAEVEISRTMFRAGGSEYEINGSPARLSDVQDLLSEAGLGPEMHVLIGQGQLDKILHASAAERREVIEEAAGILKYRRRQDKTARKLEAMSANLTRLNDLAAELQSQLKPLGEQAESAAAARELQARIRELNALLIARQAHALDGLLDTERERGAAATEHAEQLQQQWSQAHADGLEHDTHLESLRATQAAHAEQLSHLNQLLTRTHATASVAAERAKTGQQNADMTGYDAEVNRAAERMEADEQALTQSTAALEQARETLQQAAEVAESARAQVQSIEQKLTAHAAAAQQERQRRAELTEAAAVARAGYERANDEETNRRAEVEQLTAEAAGIAGQRAEAEAARTAAEAEHDAHEQCLTKIRQERMSAEEKRDAAREEAARTAQEAAGARERAATLREALGTHLNQEEPQGASSPAAENLLRVLDVITIEPGWEKAAASALAQLATAALNAPRTASISRILPAGSPNSAPEKHPEPVMPPTVKAHAAHNIITIRAEDPAGTGPKPLRKAETQALKAALDEQLAGVYCAPTAHHARAALKAGARLAIDTHGIVYSRHAELHPDAGASALELAAAARTAQEHAEATARLAQHAAQKLTAAEKKLAETLTTERDTAKTLGQARAALSAAQTAQERITVRGESMDAELRRAQERLETARTAARLANETYAHARAELDAHETAQQHPAEAALTHPPTTQQALEAELAAARDAHTQAEKTRQEAHSVMVRIEAEYAAAQTALTRAQDLHQRAISTRQNAHAAAAHTQCVAQRAQGTHARALALAHALEHEIAKLRQHIADTTGEIEKITAQRTKNRAEQQELETARAAALTLAARSETDIARIETRRENLSERAQLLTSLTLDEITAAHPQAAAGDEEVSEETLKERLTATEAELRRLGSVNPLALEEYEALTERHSYLREQIADLKKSRADLNTVMDEVTSRITEVFTAALADINEHYEHIFATLFPGGQGRLELTDPEDTLNSGIEIFARPAGKKVKRLSLLSGGERSLASLALLIAIFMARPSPFYALDEVEAALDDRNLGRLLEVIEQLGQRSQLILITHQKRTMQVAQTLYGVSMREGVSTVISQSVEELRELL